jgi:plastocyanin
MRVRATLTATALVLGGTGVAAGLSSAAGGGEGGVANAAVKKPVTRSVKVADNFYSPKRLTVPPKSTIKWKWSRLNAETHDVYLDKRPKGVRHFQSAPAATFYSYKRKLRKPGVYKLLCTFHENMTMRVTVKR